MEIAKNLVVGIDYILKDQDGEVVDSTQGQEPLIYLHGSGMLLPKMEASLDGKQKGDNFQLVLNPEDGYGVYDDNLKQVVDRSSFEVAELEVGARFIVGMEGEEENNVVTVTDIDGDQVTIDGNHELAGMTLNFDVTITEVREATQEELDHGHAHGPGGHNH